MVVVVGVDTSDHAIAVVKTAIAEARRRDAALHVVHVFHPPVIPYLGAPVDLRVMADAEREAVWNHINPHLARIDIEVEQVNLEGYPPDALVDYVVSVEADLLVVGSRGRGELAALILGSTSHRAVHLAPCDVLVVKPSHA
jgi:nucleotide-binding universal stress UspA family protein